MPDLSFVTNNKSTRVCGRGQEWGIQHRTLMQHTCTYLPADIFWSVRLSVSRASVIRSSAFIWQTSVSWYCEKERYSPLQVLSIFSSCFSMLSSCTTLFVQTGTGNTSEAELLPHTDTAHTIALSKQARNENRSSENAAVHEADWEPWWREATNLLGTVNDF